MSIEELLAGTPHRWARGGGDVVVADVTHDSRRAGPGVVFVAMKGAKDDGLRFAPDAVSRGAAAVVVDGGRADAPELAGAAGVIEVPDGRVALAVMARNLHGRVDEKLAVVGVTGTNGKTTTCRIAASILEAAGIRCGSLGTVSYSLGDEEIAADRTTPEAPDIHRYLARMAASGCGACVMEVSSHSLALRRVHGMKFAVAAFTNLTREHLDFHRDMESYFEAKAMLFADLRPGATAAINVDDAFGRRLADRLDPAVRLITFGERPEASVRMTSAQLGARGTRVMLASAEGTFELDTPLIGRPNAFNVTAAAAIGRAMGIGWEAIAAGVGRASFVPGRMERIGDGDFQVIVDYAHKEEALRSLLETVRSFTTGRLIVVFGCGGDRDRTKRPIMGRHAATLADRVWVTSDNPRTEDPGAIIEEILSGMTAGQRSGGRVQVEPDRRRAIEGAIVEARPSDSVVIAGKGHETYQILGDRVIPFDDRVVAREALERRGGSPRG